jgi:hypothetical protein
MGTRSLFSTGILPTKFTSTDSGPPAAPVNTVAPALSGDFFVGQTLTCSTGTWTNSPISYTYQWRNAGVDIGGATSSTYVLVAGDDGDSITCNVTATNGSGSASQISNAVVAIQLIFWLDGADTSTITHVSNLVSQWNDKSGSGVNATQPVGADQPSTNIATINSKNVVTFTKASLRHMELPVSTLPFGAETVFIVHKPTSTTTNEYLLSVTGNGGAQTRRYNMNQGVDYGNAQLNNPSLTSGSGLIQMSGVTGGSGSQTQYIAINGGTVTTGSVSRSGVNTSDWTLGGFRAAGIVNGQCYDGDIAEVIVCGRDLSNSIKNQIGNHLETKWGITWSDV